MTTLIDCPACKRPVKVPDELLGQTVRCPLCGHTFTSDPRATTASAPPPPVAEPPLRTSKVNRDDDDFEEERSRRRRTRGQRDDYDDEDEDDRPRRRRRRSRRDDYEDDYPERRPAPANSAGGMAVAGMVLGLVGFLLGFIPCLGWIFGIILGTLGAVFSGIAMASSHEGKGMAVAGLVLSILAIIWCPLAYFLILASLRAQLTG